MSDDKEKSTGKGRGGRRPGAGRPRGTSRLYTFRAGGELAEALDAQEDRTGFIKSSIKMALDAGAGDGAAGTVRRQAPDISRLGHAVPASRVRSMSIPSFDMRVVAGFPVPLDNDEKSQDIDMLRLLCPHPESSYLIRVQGESMIDAGIENGDIVIVDKSRRDPSGKEVAVCELNGEYTLKHFVMEDGVGWLVPANPDYPRFKVTENDDFSIWGTVTYIIHKARD